MVGAGATGVEMAGQISELARRTLRKDYRNIDTTKTRIVLVDALDDVLGAFGTKLSAGAAKQLKKLGIEVWLSEKVVAVDDHSLTVEDKSGARTRLAARTVVWAAGVQGVRPGPHAGRAVRRRDSIAAAASRCSPTARCPGTRRSSSSAT